MSGPTLPAGSGPVPPAGSAPGPTSIPGPAAVPLKTGQPALDTPALDTPALDAQDAVISVIAERLRVGKRVVEGEGVRVRVVTDEAAALASVTLRSERIEVERVAVGRVVEGAPPVREENGVTIIPVMEEVAVTATRLVLKEELHVRRVADTREHQETVLLRRQRAEVERLPATGKPVADAATSTPTKENPR